MPNCVYCLKPFKTRGTLAKHHRLYHDGKSRGDGDPPMKFTLTFFVNQVQQTLSCPLCSFSRNRCRNVKAIAAHFQKVHPSYQLCVSYHCQWCNDYIDPAEIYVHVHAHSEHMALGKPFSPPRPQIDPANNSLSFVDDNGVPATEGADWDIAIPETQPETQPKTPVASISIHANDGDVESIVDVKPPTPSPAAVVIPPSYRDILLRTSPSPELDPSDVVVPSPPSPILFDPSHSQISSYDSGCNRVVNPGNSTPAASSSKQKTPSPQPILSPVGPVVPQRLASVQPEVVPDVNSSCSGVSVSVQGTLDFVSSVNTPITPSSTYSDPDPPSDPPPLPDVTVQPEAPVRLLKFPSPPTPRLLKSTPSSSDSEAVPTTPLSVSPCDSPSQKQLLLGSSPSSHVPQLPIPVDHTPSRSRGVSQVFNKVRASRLPVNDLCHRLVAGAVPGFSDVPSETEAVLPPSSVHPSSKNDLVIDVDALPPPPPSSLCQVNDERRVILMNDPVAVSSKSQDTRQVIIEDDHNEHLGSSDETKRLRAEANRQFALKILRQTFKPIPPDPLTNLDIPTSSASVCNHSNAGLITTSTSVIRAHNVVAPPVPAVKRRNISSKANEVKDVSKSVSAQITSALSKFRPRPRSDSEEDSCYDPSPPGSPIPQNPDDVDVPIVNPPPVRDNPGSPQPPEVDPADREDIDNEDVDVFNNSQELPVESEDQQRLVEFRDRWCAIFTDDTLSWAVFSLRCAEFATEAKSLASELNRPLSLRVNRTAPPPPPPRRPPMGRRVAKFDAVAARRIQGLYRHSKKRAARRLLNDNVVSYSGSVDDAAEYFAGVFDERNANANLLGEGLNTFVPSAEDHDLTGSLFDDIVESEVSAKLRSSANTAPGADCLEYAHLKKVDPSGKIVTLIFNRCQREKNVPSA